MCHFSLLAIHFLVVVNSTKMGIQLNNLQPTCGLQENSRTASNLKSHMLVPTTFGQHDMPLLEFAFLRKGF
jgi:hypothetical protein